MDHFDTVHLERFDTVKIANFLKILNQTQLCASLNFVNILFVSIRRIKHILINFLTSFKTVK